MRQLAYLQYEKLSPASTRKMRAALVVLHERVGGILEVGTACSGTDGISHAIEILVDVWLRRFGIKFTVQRKFACEIIEFKRAFIKDIWDPEKIFNDVMRISESVTEDTYQVMTKVPQASYSIYHIYHISYIINI